MADRNDLSVSAEQKAVIGESLANLPCGMWVLTADQEDRRMGMLVSWVQQVCFEPAMVTVAIEKGRAIMPLISESRRFALCQLGAEDTIQHRKFQREPEPHEDPFLGLELLKARQAGLPILKTSVGFLECELSCHMDVEGDHDLFVGRVIAAARAEGEPLIRLRENGFTY
ncbi:MAG: flavin reductase family protein [Planctomycetota bacterium]